MWKPSTTRKQNFLMDSEVEESEAWIAELNNSFSEAMER